MTLPPPVVPNNEVALIDERAEELGCAIPELMLRAGKALADAVQHRHPEGRVLVACGPGNNGGDGYVAARLLAEAGRNVALWPIVEPRSILCQEQAAEIPPGVTGITEPEADQQYSVILDAMLGAGISGKLRAPVAEAMQVLRALDIPCIAADIPTGLVSNEALPDTHTITFQIAKQDLDPQHSQVVDIGIPAKAINETSSVLFRRFPRFHKEGHKGDNGNIFVLAGWQFPGARHYCSSAALSAGCDLVHCYIPEGEALDHACVRHTPSSTNLSALITRCDVLLIGPGMGDQHGELIDEVFSIACEQNIPCVLDADAVHHLKYKLRGNQHPPLIITPHRGELRALTGNDDYDEAAVHEFAAPNKVILAKGAVDFISDGQQWQHNPYGNPRLAVGGTGDVLAGLCAGLLARGCSLFDAARLAVYWECMTADQLWQDMGPCYLPDDILGELAQVLRQELSAKQLWPPG